MCDSANADEDCDSLADDADASVASTGKTRYYPDDDNDSYGDLADPGTLYCDDPSSGAAHWRTNNTDCNDNNASIHPGAPEVCNGLDDNCDGMIDEVLVPRCIPFRTDY